VRLSDPFFNPPPPSSCYLQDLGRRMLEVSTSALSQFANEGFFYFPPQFSPSLPILGKFKPGMYATSVMGRLSDALVESLDEQGIKYHPRDGAMV